MRAVLCWVVLVHAILAAGVARALDAEAIAELNQESVVTLFSARDGQPRAIQGTGCLVDPSGLVLTVAHTVADGGAITVRLKNGSEHPADLLMKDDAHDLALLRTREPMGRAATVGDASALKAGSPLVAISAPGGLDASVSTGIVANLDRVYNGRPVLQTDLNLNAGSSGGPVFDRDGQLVGVIASRVEEVDEATLVSPINQAYPLLRKSGVTIPPPGQSAAPYAALLPAPAATDAERAAIEAYNRGVAASSIEEKVARYEAAVQAFPAFFEAWYNLGVAYTAAGRGDDAIEAYRKAQALRADSLPVLRNLGRLYLKHDRFEDVLACFEEASRIAPHDAGTQNDLGEAYRRLGRLDSAADCFRKALQLRPDYAAARYNLGLVCMAQERWAEALSSFRSYLNLAPDAADAGKVREMVAELEKKSG